MLIVLNLIGQLKSVMLYRRDALFVVDAVGSHVVSVVLVNDVISFNNYLLIIHFY